MTCLSWGQISSWAINLAVLVNFILAVHFLAAEECDD